MWTQWALVLLLFLFAILVIFVLCVFVSAWRILDLLGGFFDVDFFFTYAAAFFLDSVFTLASFFLGESFLTALLFCFLLGACRLVDCREVDFTHHVDTGFEHRCGSGENFVALAGLFLRFFLGFFKRFNASFAGRLSLFGLSLNNFGLLLQLLFLLGRFFLLLRLLGLWLLHNGCYRLFLFGSWLFLFGRWFSCALKVDFSYHLRLADFGLGLNLLLLFGLLGLFGLFLLSSAGEIFRLEFLLHVGLEFLDEDFQNILRNLGVGVYLQLNLLFGEEVLDGLKSNIQIFDNFT